MRSLQSTSRPRTSRFALIGALAAVLVLVFGVTAAGATQPGDLLGPAVDANPSGQTAIAWARADEVRVLTASRATGTAWVTTLATTRGASRPLVAVDDAGGVIVVWETSHASDNFPCRGCSPLQQSDGVFAVVGRVGGTFGPVVRLAGPLVAGSESFTDRLAVPLLRMDAVGHAVIVGSDGADTWVATRESGAAIGAPQPAGKDFVASGAALGGNGEVLLTDIRARVVTRPAGGAFGPPVALPEANTPFGPGADIAANAAGDAVALYGGYFKVLASRRGPDGSWGAPVVLSTVNGAAPRRVAIAPDGTAVTTFAQADREPYLGGRPALLAAILHPDGTQTRTQINTDGTYGDLDSAPDVDPDGRFLVGYSQSLPTNPAQHYIKVLQQDGSASDATEITGSNAAAGSAQTVVAGDASMVSAWTTRAGTDVLLHARWLPSTNVATLDRATYPGYETPVARPRVEIIAQPTRHLDRRGRILIALRCIGQSECKGDLRLIAGPTHWTAARVPYAIASGAERRARVTLTARAKRALRTQGHLTLQAGGIHGRLRVTQ